MRRGNSPTLLKVMAQIPPASTEKSISWDHLKPATVSENQTSNMTDQNLSPSTQQRDPSSTNLVHSNPASAHQATTSAMESSQSPNASTYTEAVPAALQPHVQKATELVNDLEQNFRTSFAPDSHDLAHRDHEIKGEVQKQPILESGAQVKDLGWHKNVASMPDPLIGGVANDSLFAMIRRFNKVTSYPRLLPFQI